MAVTYILGVNMAESEVGHKSVKISHKILSLLFIVFIIIISIFVYIHREKVQALGPIGYIGAFILCFISNATVFLPAPSLAVVAFMSLALNPFFVALFGSVGSTLGETVGYCAGYMGKNIVDTENSKVAASVKKYGTIAIFIFAFLPLPLFDVAGVASGYFRHRIYKFLFACFLGKFLKMVIIAFGADYFINYLSF